MRSIERSFHGLAGNDEINGKNGDAIKKLAVVKGCTAEQTATIKHKQYVGLIGTDGGDIPGTRGV